MTTISLDKYAEQILAMRDQANRNDPGAASRIQVYGLTGQAGTKLNQDGTFPGLAELRGPHFHRPGVESTDEHTFVSRGQADNWPECVILT